MSTSAGAESDTPINVDPTDSSAVEAALSKETSGAGSSSMIVICWLARFPRVAFDGVPRSTVTVSLASNTRSLATVREIVAEAAPAGIVSGVGSMT